MKTTLKKYYENREPVYSKSFCFNKTGFIYKIQMASNLIKSKTLLQLLIILNLFIS